jgi:Ca2+-binding RTX toxin-like protein
MSTTNGTSNNDSLYGTYGDNNTINGLAGDDYIVDNSYGTDTLNGGSGNDQLYSYDGGNDTLNGGTGNDTLVMDSWYEGGTLNGGDGNDTLILGYTSSGILNGDAGDDILSAENTDGYFGPITLNGGSGKDIIYAPQNGSMIDGGTGNDTIYASTGYNGSIDVFNNIQMLRNNSNQDTVKNYTIFEDSQRLASNHLIQLDSGIAASSLDFSFSGNNLVIKIKGTTASVVVEDFLTTAQQFNNNNEYYYSGLDSVAIIQLNNGSFISAADALSYYKPTRINGDEFDNTISGNDTHNIIFGLQGNDILYGMGGNDIIEGGSGNDEVYGGDGNDDLRGYTGDDQIYGGSGNDSLTGGSGNDILVGGAGSDLLDGGTGNDTYIATADTYYSNDLNNTDTYVFGRKSGQDTLVFDSNYYYDNFKVLTNSRIQLEAGIVSSDIKVNISGSDLVISITGTANSFTIKNYMEVVNYAQASYGDFLVFSDGSTSSLSTLMQRAEITGTDGDDVLDFSHSYSYLSSNPSINGGAGNDVIYGFYYGDNKLNGGAGNDYIQGGDYNDVINGGSGNDTLIVSSGSDTYLFGTSSGQDTLSTDNYYYYGSSSTIKLDAGINISDVKISLTGDNLVIGIKNSTATMTIENIKDYLESSYYSSNANLVVDAKGNGLSVSDVAKLLVVEGTESDDSLFGFDNYANTIYGLDGNDVIRGGVAADFLDGGNGNDSLYGSNGDDVLMGGDGDDWLEGGSGNDTLRGGRGNDLLFGEEGNDTFNGYTGDDILIDYQGSDTYTFMKKDGHDQIFDSGFGTDIDTIKLTDQLASEVIVTRNSPDDLRIESLRGGFSITVNGQFEEGAESSIEQVVFADGKTWDEATILSLASQGATTGDDVIIADTNHNVIFANAGDDYITGNANDNVLAGEGGKDVLSGEAGDDILLGGDGSDKLKGGLGNDWLSGGTGRDHLLGQAGNDILNGDSGEDKLEGGLDSDILAGGTSQDTYVFNKGDGQDLIIDADTGTSAAILSFGKGVQSTDLSFTRQENQLIIQLKGTDDQLTIKDYFGTASNLGMIKFADGTSLSSDALLSMTSTLANQGLISSDRADYLFATAQSTTLSGMGGNDVLVGNTGNDWLDGGAGDDLLFGGDGVNGYQFGRNSGHDTVLSNTDAIDLGLTNRPTQPTYQSGQDYIALDADIKIDQLWMTRVDNDLVINVLGSDSDITLSDFFYDRQWMDYSHLNAVDQVITGGYQAIDLHSYEAMNLINAMSSMTPPAAGQTQLTGEARTVLTPLLAAAWN